MLMMACSNEFDPLSETMFDVETDSINEPDNDSNFFLNSNGITIMCPDTSPGETGKVDEVEYESVDRALLIQRRDEGADLTSVCTSLVTDMSEMFREIDFNQSIGNWDVSNVTDMSYMFAGSLSDFDEWTHPFNQAIGDWDVSNVTDMSFMFASTSSFNQPIGNWDVSNVTDMSGMFEGNTLEEDNAGDPIFIYTKNPFNQQIGDWNVGSVTNMRRMFNVSQFNQSIENWNMSNVTNTSNMFSRSEFNQPIGNWNVSNVTNMFAMFLNSEFNQPLNRWCVSLITSEPGSFSSNSPLTERNQPVWGTCPSTDFTCGDLVTFNYSGDQVTYGTVESANGRCWFDRNLGASRVATSSTDQQSYGDLFQWGRAADGHQRRDSPTTTTLSNSDQPGHGEFIISPDSPNDWRIPQNNNLWQGEDGINNPCPKDYRLPSEAEWQIEIDSWNIQHGSDGASKEAAFNSPLKLPLGGRRDRLAAMLDGAGSYGRYWSSTVSGTGSQVLRLEENDIFWVSNFRAGAFSVRCIKDE